jgi:hypothetical protein
MSMMYTATEAALARMLYAERSSLARLLPDTEFGETIRTLANARQEINHEIHDILMNCREPDLSRLPASDAPAFEHAV